MIKIYKPKSETRQRRGNNSAEHASQRRDSTICSLDILQTSVYGFQGGQKGPTIKWLFN